MANGLLWWKVTTSTSGDIVTCELAVDREHDTGLIFFVRAKDTKAAGRLAFNRYMLAITKARHAQYAREGRCRCGRTRDVEGRKLCALCLEANGRYLERSRAKAKGEEPPPKLPRAVVLAANRAEDEGAFRLKILREVHSKMLGFQGDRPKFVSWLLSEIEKAASATRKGAA